MSWFDFVHQFPAFWQNERTRTQILSSVGVIAGVGGAIASYAILREPLKVRLDHLTIRLPHATGHVPASGLRLLHLSDTHFRGANWREQAKIDCIRKACAELEYDLLIHTGDFLQHDSGLPNLLMLLDALPAPRLAGYGVFGNHDYCTYSRYKLLKRAWANFQAESRTSHTYNGNGNGNGQSSGHVNGQSNGRVTPLARARTLYEFGQYCANVPMDLNRTGNNDVNMLEAVLAARQIQTLHNRYIRLTHPELGIDLYLAGVEHVVKGTPKLPHVLAEIPYDAPTILLCHNPDILAEPGIEQADLVLAGHTHGGQVVIPLFGPAHTHTNHLRRHEASGYLRRGKTQVYITRGVGEGIPLRFGASPQIALITLLPA